jgi:hypothetical protein
MGITIDGGCLNNFNSFNALPGDAVNNPPIGTAKNPNFSFEKP